MDIQNFIKDMNKQIARESGDDIKILEKKIISYTEVKVSNNFIYRKYNKK